MARCRAMKSSISGRRRIRVNKSNVSPWRNPRCLSGAWHFCPVSAASIPVNADGLMGFGIVESIRRTLTGKVVQKTDIALGNGTTISLRLKARDGRFYVVMACTAGGNYQYYPMDLREFQALTEAMLATKAAIETSTSST